MFKKVLVANRGDAAVRVIRTLREMGIGAVAVFSEADRDGLHVALADEAVALGDSEPSKSYCNVEKVIGAAKATGCDAVHPGYGFLAEDAGFARAVLDAGLAFIGPSPEVLVLVGNKVEARSLLAEAGIDIVPGSQDVISGEWAEKEAERIGYPLLVKSVVGGGGRGIRVAQKPADLASALREASDESFAAFLDKRVYLEKLLERPRHIEVQVIRDRYGGAVHLFERECSLQRRFQKVIEESPAPGLSDVLKEAIANTALRAMETLRFEGVGTVEFLLDRRGRFWFLEANPRLQVEHPVTEMRTGLDLVRLQIEIACGMGLSLRQEDVHSIGHAIECRIYAEDPQSGFAPRSGPILMLRPPGGPGVRADLAVIEGSSLSQEYDPLIAKVVVLAEDRTRAISRMVRALEETVVLGVDTSIEFLRDILKSDRFISGNIDTSYLEEFAKCWKPDESFDAWAALGYRLECSSSADQAKVSQLAPLSPWKALKHFGR